jgi:hypothetical protein
MENYKNRDLDLEEIGQFYIEAHELPLGLERMLIREVNLENLGKEVSIKFFNGDIGKAYNSLKVGPEGLPKNKVETKKVLHLLPSKSDLKNLNK